MRIWNWWQVLLCLFFPFLLSLFLYVWLSSILRGTLEIANGIHVIVHIRILNSISWARCQYANQFVKFYFISNRIQHLSQDASSLIFPPCLHLLYLFLSYFSYWLRPYQCDVNKLNMSVLTHIHIVSNAAVIAVTATHQQQRQRQRQHKQQQQLLLNVCKPIPPISLYSCFAHK